MDTGRSGLVMFFEEELSICRSQHSNEKYKQKQADNLNTDEDNMNRRYA